MGGGAKAAQTVFPGSVHPSGEAIEWAASGAPTPTEVPFAQLKTAVTEIAIGVLLMRGWVPGGRHEGALRVGALLRARAGWSADDIRSFVQVVAIEANDDDPSDRSHTAAEAAENFAHGGRTYGLPAFKHHFGDDVGNAVARWLEYREPDGDTRLARMNERYCVLPVAGKARVLAFDEISLPSRKGSRRMAVFSTFSDFKNLHDHEGVSVGERRVGLGSWWLGQAERRQYEGLIFAARTPNIIDGHLNLWQGWGVEPKPGCWALMRNHIKHVLAADDDRGAEYILKWTAWSLPKPWDPGGSRVSVSRWTRHG